MDKELEALKNARAEIEAILRKYDLGGHVVLFRPGWLETFYNLWPSYSILQGDFPEIRVYSNREEYPSAEAQHTAIEQTCSMVSGVGKAIAENGLLFLKLAEVLDERFDAIHTRGPKTYDPFDPNPRTN